LHGEIASFDCRSVSAGIERVICDDSELNKLNAEMGRLYHKAKHIPGMEISNLSVRPGKKIGRVKAVWINQVQVIMDRYMKENGIKEKKILLLHMFRHTMVEHKERLIILWEGRKYTPAHKGQPLWLPLIYFRIAVFNT
jgi:hypothetical protein